jgi:hypothetical protein
MGMNVLIVFWHLNYRKIFLSCVEVRFSVFSRESPNFCLYFQKSPSFLFLWVLIHYYKSYK